MDNELTIIQLVLLVALTIERMYEQCLKRVKRSQCCGSNIEFGSVVDLNTHGSSQRRGHIAQSTQTQPQDSALEAVDLHR